LDFLFSLQPEGGLMLFNTQQTVSGQQNLKNIQQPRIKNKFNAGDKEWIKEFKIYAARSSCV
jgi:hypothetical protein